MLCIQVWAYYQRYPNDGISYNILVRGYEYLCCQEGLADTRLGCAQVVSLWYASPARLRPPANLLNVFQGPRGGSSGVRLSCYLVLRSRVGF